MPITYYCIHMRVGSAIAVLDANDAIKVWKSDLNDFYLFSYSYRCYERACKRGIVFW